MKKLLGLIFAFIHFNVWPQSRIEKMLIRKINQFRLENCLDTAEYSPRLSKASYHHAKWMSVTGVLSHEESKAIPGWERLETLKDRLVAYNCFENDFRGSNENAMFSVGMSTEKAVVEQIFNGWKNSPPHRENMLAATNPSRKKFLKSLIGISIVKVLKSDFNEYAAILNMGFTFRSANPYND